MKDFFKYLAVASITASLTFGVSAVMFSGVNEFKENEYGSRLASKIDKVDDYIKHEYLYDDYDMDEMDESAVKAYVEALGEPYTHYYPPEEFTAYMSGVEDSYVGIGVVITVDKDDIIIVAPTEDSPAREAGIKPGDKILAVDGETFKGDEMNECVSKIRSGRAGTKVTLKIERDGEKMDIEVERKEILTHSVKSEMLDGSVGYIRISEFNTSDKDSDEDTYKEFKEQVRKLRSDGMKSMVIDLRDNPGGVLDEVVDIADYLLPEGVITYTETKSGKRTEYKSDKSEVNMPIVVLINGNSASAAEILTGALKDFGKAQVVGTKSFGKGIVQSVYPFSDGSGMSVTVANYYTPSGVCIHGVGIEPDHKVELDEKYKDKYIPDIPHGEDTQLLKALELLK